MALACRAGRAEGRQMQVIGHKLKRRGLPLAARNRHGNQRVDEIAQAAKHIVRCRSQPDADVIRRQHECGDRKQVAHKREGRDDGNSRRQITIFHQQLRAWPNRICAGANAGVSGLSWLRATIGWIRRTDLESPFRLNRNGVSSLLFDAFSSREPVPTSLENALIAPVAPHVARRESVLTAEAPVEVGEVAEADVIGDGADRILAGGRIAEHPMRAGQSLPDQKLREGGAFRFEQALHIARRHVEACGDRRNRRGSRSTATPSSPASPSGTAAATPT